MEDNYRPVIIGAGVAGCAFAYYLTKNNEKPIVIERNKTVGGKACTGLVSKRISEIFPLPKKLVKNRIKTAIVHFPNGDLEIKGKEEALVLDRDGFVEEMYEMSKQGGTDYLFDERLLRFVVADKVICKTDRRTFKTDVLVGADGVGSVVAQKYGLCPENRSIIQAFAEYKTDVVEIFPGKDYGYPFGYVVPYEDDTSIVGMGGSRAGLEKFLDFIGAKKVFKWQAGAVPFGIPKYSAFERVMLAGDAGGFVKAFSGGSININLLLAKIGAKAIRNAYESGNFSTNFLTKSYENVWKKDFGKELKDNFLLRKAYDTMNEKDLSKLYNILQKERMQTIVAEKADMDFYSDLLRTMMKERSLWGLGLKVLAKNPGLLRHIF
jgi:flavin-dependent dehydrogenase